MFNGLRGMTVAVALLGGVTVAAAQMNAPATSAMPGGSAMKSQLNLTSAQKQAIAQQVAPESPAAAPFSASVGTKVPESIALHPLPLAVANKIPAVKNYSFAKLHNNDIVVVDPKNRMVADVIHAQASTTGSGAGLR